MTTNRTEQLIVDLAAGLAPVRRVPPVSLRLMRWAVAGVLITAVAVWAMGVRADISAALSVPDVLTTFCLTLLGSVSAAMVALRLSVPGVESRWTRWAPLGLMTLLVAVLVHLAREAGVSPLAIAHEPFHTACVARVAALALVPTWLLVHEIRRGFALDPASTTAWPRSAAAPLRLSPFSSCARSIARRTCSCRTYCPRWSLLSRAPLQARSRQGSSSRASNARSSHSLSL